MKNKKNNISKSSEDTAHKIAMELTKNLMTGKFIFPLCIVSKKENNFLKLSNIYNDAIENDNYSLAKEISTLLTIYYWLKKNGALIKILQDINTVIFFEEIWIQNHISYDEQLIILRERLNNAIGKTFSKDELNNKVKAGEIIFVHQKPLKNHHLTVNKLTKKDLKKFNVKGFSKYKIDLKLEMEKIIQNKFQKEEAYQLIGQRLFKLGYKKMNPKTLEKRIERVRFNLSKVDLNLYNQFLISTKKVFKTDKK